MPLIKNRGRVLEEEVSLEHGQCGILTGFFDDDGHQGVKVKRWV